VEALILDVRAAPRGERWTLVRQHLFPPREYLTTTRWRFGRGPVPLLHAQRLLRGATRWLLPTAENRH
jgi:hypothetical protein